MSEVTRYLIGEHGFTEYRETRPDPYGVDNEKLSCIKRIADIHYLCYSEDYGHFSLRVMHERPKGGQGKSNKKEWTSIMIPRVCRDIEVAKEIIKAIAS